MTASFRPRFALIACDVFREEIDALGRDTPQWSSIEWLEMGLHDQPDRLRSAVQAAIDRLEMEDKIDAVVLAYGLCGNGLAGIRAGRHPLVIPRAHDCISVLLGSPAKHETVRNKNPGTYFYSPGWIRGKRVPGPDREAHLRAFYAERYEDDEEMVEELIEVDREAYEHNNCAGYVDITENKEAQAYCRRCAESMGWTYEHLEGDPRLLQSLLDGQWDDARFLKVPPGKAIGVSMGQDIFKVVD